jgi:polyadenylate-binding protein
MEPLVTNYGDKSLAIKLCLSDVDVCCVCVLVIVSMTTQPTTNVAASASKDQFSSLYVGDLTSEVTEAVLYEIFNAVGPVASIRVCRDSVTRKSLGYAYVNFHNASDAERAMEALNYTDIKGQPCRIMWCHRDPATRRNASGNIFIKNLDKSIEHRALYDTFSTFGHILSCKIATDADNKSRGFAFVHFDSEEAATAAIEKCNGMQLGEKTIYVGPFAKSTERPQTDKPFTNIYVKHMPEEWTDEILKSEFDQFGEITSCMIRVDNKSRRFGFVNYKNFDDAKAAVDAMHGKDLRSDKEQPLPDETEMEDGVFLHQLYVVRAQTKAERQAELKTKFNVPTTPGKAAAAAPAVAAAQQNSNLYIKNLSESVDDEELQRMFEQFGSITSAKIMKDEKGVSRCFGFVCFSTADEATRAVTEMHLKLVNGKPLYVGLHERRDQRLERLQQRYRLNAMSSMGGMNPGMMMQQQQRNPGMPGMMGGYPGQQNMYFNGGRPAMQMPQRMPQPAAAGGFPAVPGRPQMMMRPMPVPTVGGAVPKMMPMTMAPRQPGMQMAPRQQQVPMRPGYQFAGAPQPARAQPWPEVPFDPSAPLTAAALAAAPPAMQKQMLGEKLFPLIVKYQPELAGKITGMMLEMDNSELLILLESEPQLRAKVEEAIRVLHGQ